MALVGDTWEQELYADGLMLIVRWEVTAVDPLGLHEHGTARIPTDYWWVDNRADQTLKPGLGGVAFRANTEGKWTKTPPAIANRGEGWSQISDEWFT